MKTVLVVEDDLDFSSLLDIYLGSHYTVVVMRDGEEALDWLRENHADAVILDIMMPNVSGVEVLRRMQYEPTQAKNIPVLLMTAARFDAAMEAFLRLEPNVKGLVHKAQGLLPFLRHRIEAIVAPARA